MPRVLPSQVVQTIEKHFPNTKSQQNVSFEIYRTQQDECAAISSVLEQIPAELLNPPLLDDYIELISNIAILNRTLESWKTPNTTRELLTGKAKANPISIIHDMLLQCPDEVISSKTVGLEFIDDIDFRNCLRLDLTSVNNALSNGEFKAVTVLAGSIAEALLLWAINKETLTRQGDLEKVKIDCNIKEKDVNRWGLNEYNRVAKGLGIISEKTYSQVDLARDFRDLIHPGREKRKNAKCNIATAHSGMAAFELVIEDLSIKYATSPEIK